MAWPLIKLLPAKTNFRFVAFSKFAAILSVVLVIGSIASVLIPFEGPCGGLNCGVDFKGGTVLDMNRGGQPIDLGALRDTLNDAEGLHDVQVQGDGGKNVEAMIRFETPEGGNPAQKVDEIKTHLSGKFEGAQFTRTEVVGPKVSGELLTGGVMALFFAILLMMVYIWFRFEWQFGVGAALGLLHDVILTFGLFALFNLEFTLTAVAAILTIIGYSMNDTVVVCDRLRENLRKYKKMPLADVIDLSLNETLSRTIMTGITAVGALVGLAVLGGEALFGFSIALIFGIIVGTYSSIYVAAPVILIWGVNRSDADAEIVDMGGFKGKR
ncbi:protein translocase subunit SecF [Asticcacaulis machinosus]|uniref:Protein-export membrane protein SecF n=1 Tax=Asticcacaulis machinosus TaxID=2984211 RepID=A0ABT5HFJ0_9CAUL|nr:protein translocase subunit SecF [Asticcacaulis machinosus]MDC7675016.1 protein translocase subunit SecF [Asticcacaulis machinosus]